MNVMITLKVIDISSNDHNNLNRHHNKQTNNLSCLTSPTSEYRPAGGRAGGAPPVWYFSARGAELCQRKGGRARFSDA